MALINKTWEDAKKLFTGKTLIGNTTLQLPHSLTKRLSPEKSRELEDATGYGDKLALTDAEMRAIFDHSITEIIQASRPAACANRATAARWQNSSI
jgi:hypothetical protein